MSLSRGCGAESVFDWHQTGAEAVGHRGLTSLTDPSYSSRSVMIECVFTIDYEIYGNGDGTLSELILEPAEKLRNMFVSEGFRFVVFVEAAELEIIEINGTDAAIGDVRNQIRRLHQEGFEIGLHLHPQWYNARQQDGAWILDYDEYDLCKLPRKRVVEIIDRSIEYLRGIVGKPDFVPLSFRAGNWLFQPAAVVADVIATRGIKLDSSVFKGGMQRQYGLDYRGATRNGYYWSFSEHVDVPDPSGKLVEIPTYTRMVPFWRMLTRKRIDMRRKGPSSGGRCSSRINRFRDLVRFRYPLKLDFCRMTLGELTSALDAVACEDAKDPAQFRPIVAIGHTKDLVDYTTILSFLALLKDREITVSTFDHVYPRCKS